MSRPLLWFLWRRHRLAILLSLMIPIMIGCILGLVYPQLRPQLEFIKKLPLVQRFMSGQGVDPLSPASFFAFPLQHPLCLILFAILPAIPVLALPAGERGRGGLDLLLATHLERRQLMATLFTFALLLLPALLLSLVACVVCGGALSGDLATLPLPRYVMASIAALGLTVFWSGLVMLVSACARDRTQANMFYAGFVVLAFAVDAASRMAPPVAWLSAWSPYGWYRPTSVVGGNQDWLAHAIGLALTGVALAVIAAEAEHRRRAA